MIGCKVQRNHTWVQVGIGYGAHVACSNCGSLLKNKDAHCMFPEYKLKKGDSND